MKLIVFDFNKEFVEEAKRLEKYGIEVIHSDVEALINNRKVDALVSPANSFGYMNGGIDGVYSSMFPGIQGTVQSAITKLGTTDHNRDFIPVGSAITVETGDKRAPLMVCAPTMFTPSNIRGKNNVVYAFVAILYVAKKNGNSVVAVPGLGTGVGGLSPKEAVDQMDTAIRMYNNIISNQNYLSNIKVLDNLNIVLKNDIC